MVKLMSVTGIVVKKIDYKASSRLIHVFTKEAGLLTVGVSGVSAKKTKHLALSSPLTMAHFQIKQDKGRYRLTDGSLLPPLQTLRSNLSALKASFEILQAINATQMPENPAPNLFDLTLFCLSQLDKGVSADPLLALFFIKMLKHEGLVPLPSSFFAPSSQLHFTPHEKALIDQFTHQRFMHSLDLIHFSSAFLDKVRSCFKVLYSA